ncbi:MAG: hypothetical protein ACKO28_08440, partial [Cyanobium sp.]
MPLESILIEDITLSAALPLSTRFGPAHAIPPAVPAAATAPASATAQGEPMSLELTDPLRHLLARHQVLVPLLRQWVIGQAVGGVVLSEEEQQQAQKAWLQKQGIQSHDQLQSHLALNGMTEDDARWQAELPTRIHHYCQEHFLHRAEQRFLGRKQQLDTVIYSLLRVSSEPLANELYLRIAEGEADFAELAATYAEGM